MQDLVVRGFCVALGALWAGLAYVARNGNPFVMAAFAIVYMLPMLYRYTQSTHPVRFHFSSLPLLLLLLHQHQNLTSVIEQHS